MPRHLSPIVLILCLILCLAVTGSPLAASPTAPTQLPRAAGTAKPTAQADWLGRLWHDLTVLWGAEGCGLDPSGARCASSNLAIPPGAAVAPALVGCGLDSSGRCSR